MPPTAGAWCPWPVPKARPTAPIMTRHSVRSAAALTLVKRRPESSALWQYLEGLAGDHGLLVGRDGPQPQGGLGRAAPAFAAPPIGVRIARRPHPAQVCVVFCLVGRGVHVFVVG